MFLSKQEIFFILTIAVAAPIILTSFIAYLLYRHNMLQKNREIEMRNSILSTQEEERKRIASDLHDDIGSNLTGIKYLLSFDDNDSKERILSNTTLAKQELGKAIELMRLIIHDIYSSDIATIGMSGSLTTYVERLHLTHITISLDLQIDDHRFSYFFQLNVYRICVELISNSIKHSNADYLSLSLSESENRVHLNYKDNGSKEASTVKHGIGLENIHKRVHMLNGNIKTETNTFHEGAIYEMYFYPFQNTNIYIGKNDLK
ncbi:MAG: hypothetical protein RL641_425 [Candidatus Parcubacteria bacterium]|jgi:signal transduction histidine kinase